MPWPASHLGHDDDVAELTPLAETSEAAAAAPNAYNTIQQQRGSNIRMSGRANARSIPDARAGLAQEPDFVQRRVGGHLAAPEDVKRREPPGMVWPLPVVRGDKRGRRAAQRSPVDPAVGTDH